MWDVLIEMLGDRLWVIDNLDRDSGIVTCVATGVLERETHEDVVQRVGGFQRGIGLEVSATRSFGSVRYPANRSNSATEPTS